MRVYFIHFNISIFGNQYFIQSANVIVPFGIITFLNAKNIELLIFFSRLFSFEVEIQKIGISLPLQEKYYPTLKIRK